MRKKFNSTIFFLLVVVLVLCFLLLPLLNNSFNELYTFILSSFLGYTLLSGFALSVFYLMLGRIILSIGVVFFVVGKKKMSLNEERGQIIFLMSYLIYTLGLPLLINGLLNQFQNSMLFLVNIIKFSFR
jgi:hypothetical protein